MTQAPVPDAYAVMLQRFSYVMGCLNEIDPKLGDEALKAIAEQFVADFEDALDAARAGMGMKREQAPAARRVAYERRDEMRWAYQADVLPKNYERDAKDAYKIGARVPPWVLEDALRFGAGAREEPETVGAY